jgi:hypothetical protein
MSAPILLPTIARAPNNPKTAPDAPTEALYKDAKYAEVKEPVRSEKKKTIRNFCFPYAASSGDPKIIKEYILNPR